MGTTGLAQDIVLAQDAVLAGPVEFSPAEIAGIVAILAGLFVLVTAPGWAMLGWAFGRRGRQRGSGRSWPAVLGGCCAGLALSAGVCAAVGGVLADGGSEAGVLAVAASWAVCWALAVVLTRGTGTQARRQPATVLPPADPPSDGWGR